MKNQYFCSQPSQLYLSHLAETKLLTTTQKQLIQLQQQKKLLLQKKLQQIQLLVTLQLLAVTLLKLNNSVRTLERIESLPCESATDFFMSLLLPFLPIFHRFAIQIIYFCFSNHKQKQDMKKTNLKETLQNWKLGNYFRELSIVITGVFITLAELIS